MEATLNDGMVVDVKDDLALVIANIGEKQGVSIGMPFQVWRDDKRIGEVRVVDVRRSISGAVIQSLESEKVPVKTGDRLKVDARTAQETQHTPTMQVRSTYRFARISAFKAREVTREIQGLPASDALDLLRFVPKKAAGLVRKTLATAVANAENNNNLNVSKPCGPGSGCRRRRHHEALSAQGQGKRRSHPQALQPHPYRSDRRNRDQAARKGQGQEGEEISATKPANGKSRRKETKEAQATKPEAAPRTKE